MIDLIHIKNFKIFKSFALSLNDDLNIIVGNNESGKSTIIEAIALALTRRINGKAIEYEITSHLFNKQCV
jgi:putative ATP-dependent endonuclease of OLD family